MCTGIEGNVRREPYRHETGFFVGIVRFFSYGVIVKFEMYKHRFRNAEEIGFIQIYHEKCLKKSC